MESSDQGQISLAYLPPTRAQTRLAIAGGTILLVALGVSVPFASKPLPRINGFIPAFDAIVSLTDLITAALLLAQFSITRSRAIWALACGYLFSSAVVVAHALTFPGAFSPMGHFGVTSHINFRVYLLWHLGLPVATFAYTWLRDKGLAKAPAHGRPEIAATVAGTGVVALASCIAWLAVLPPLDPVAGRWLTVITMLICAAALTVLWLSRRSVLDQWLMVVMFAMMTELAISGLIGARVHTDDLLDIDRIRVATLGFYTGRLFSLVTSTVVLIALLAETSKLYAAVARANTLASAVEVSQTLSREIQPPRLIEQLMTSALQNAGADRGLLLLPHQSGYRIEAEALADRGAVALRHHGVHDRASPETIIQHVSRTQERVILGDATTPNPFSQDQYLTLRRPRSVLCLALVRQGMVGGVLYLENGQVPHVFTPERARLLELLVSQAAISLANAALYADLQLQVGILQRLPVAAWTLKPDGTPDFVNQVWLDFTGQTLDFVRSHPEAWMNAVHPHDREPAAISFWEGVRSGDGFAIETRNLRAQDGSYRWHLQQAVALRDTEGKVIRFVGTTTDIDGQKRTEEALRQAQADLARINRATTMGEFAASLAHEINQPISGVITNAGICVRQLDRDSPDLDTVRAAVTRLLRDTQRAADVVGRVQSHFKRTAPSRELIDINEIHEEIVALLRDEAMRYNVSVRLELADELPSVVGDRVQLQQVAMNLIVNAIEAMKDVDRVRELIVKSERGDDDQIIVSFADTGIGFAPELTEQLFAPFFTTKSDGTGIGLRICRSIVESHGGRMWAIGTPGRGATFHFRLPTESGRLRSEG